MQGVKEFRAGWSGVIQSDQEQPRNSPGQGTRIKYVAGLSDIGSTWTASVILTRTGEPRLARVPKSIRQVFKIVIRSASAVARLSSNVRW